MDEKLVPLIGALGVLTLLLVSLVGYRLRRGVTARRSVEQDAEQRAEEEQIERGVAEGLLGRDAISGEAFPRCKICGGRAVTLGPCTSVSRLDRLPMLNTLFSLPPRYVIEDAPALTYTYCAVHKAVAVKKLEQFHAGLRADRAEFFASQADQVAMMDGGGIERSVKKQYADVAERLGDAVTSSLETPLPRLGQATVVSSRVGPGDGE